MVAGVEQSLNSTVQLALHCVRWGNSAPRTEGKSAWEECFVGPLVSHTFEDLLGADSDPVGVSVAWKGCVCIRVLQPPADAHSRCPAAVMSSCHRESCQQCLCGTRPAQRAAVDQLCSRRSSQTAYWRVLRIQCGTTFRTLWRLSRKPNRIGAKLRTCEGWAL